ncbi:hypothetical protein [Okeania sp. SIO2B3]|nr:hypothetical protein [Okeania sp. SIO2B3]
MIIEIVNRRYINVGMFHGTSLQELQAIFSFLSGMRSLIIQK